MDTSPSLVNCNELFTDGQNLFPISDDDDEEEEPTSKRIKLEPDDDEPSNNQGEEEESSDDDEYNSSDSSDLDLDIDELLEQGVDKATINTNNADDNAVPMPHEERKKVVLKKKGQDYFEMLPEGWIEVTHFSGMPVYLHKHSRVCTMAKPYYLGPGSARKHEIPISAIPCLQYRQEELRTTANGGGCPLAQHKADDQPDADPQQQTNANEPVADSTPTSTELPPKPATSKPGHKSIDAKVESVMQSRKERSLNFMAIRDYCKRCFEFQEITIRKFKTWSDRRKHMQARKLKQRPSLPEGTKLITCPLPKTSDSGEPGRNNKKEFVMNPAGKSSVCILHEFVQHAERVQPQYTFKELENASQPYSATVMIKGMAYGTGYGSSKKQAKSEAARLSLEILIPAIKDIVPDGKKPIDNGSQDLSYFDDIDILDPRVSDLCNTAGQYSPYQILVECLKRNYGLGDTEISTSVKLVKHQKNEFTMKVGDKHEVKVWCKNKREGKQRAAQAILAELFPNIKKWGPILRLYGRGSCKTPKEKKEEEQKITELQSTATANKPNYAILKKLKDEMEKLHNTKQSTLDSDGNAEGNNGTCPNSNLKHINL